MEQEAAVALSISCCRRRGDGAVKGVGGKGVKQREDSAGGVGGGDDRRDFVIFKSSCALNTASAYDSPSLCTCINL